MGVEQVIWPYGRKVYYGDTLLDMANKLDTEVKGDRLSQSERLNMLKIHFTDMGRLEKEKNGVWSR